MSTDNKMETIKPEPFYVILLKLYNQNDSELKY